jgi:hypothetical protein
MADVSSTGVLSRSQITRYSTAHLETAATNWSETGDEWEGHFEAIHRGTLAPGGTAWEGAGADAAQDGTFADVVKVRGLADHLHSAAAAARTGADDIAWAKGRALDAISTAEDAGFTVTEDLSVAERSTIPLSGAARAARQAQAEVLAADIRTQAINLAAVDKAAAATITSALAPLDTVNFADAPGRPDEAPTVQAVDYHQFKENPPPPDPGLPQPPGGWSDDPVMEDAQRIAYGHAWENISATGRA